MGLILHITTRQQWQNAEATGAYRTDSLESEGFIHCSTSEQVLGPANAMYRGRQDLVLLCIDPARVQPPIVFEDCYESGQAFPHVYGPLNVDAVVNVVDFPLGKDGFFSLPAEIGKQ
ncbi:MAG TPA: DUF952 domain-containing protein [Anaerolineae bacterium]